MTAQPYRSWPPRLRAALRARLAARGLKVPRGLVIQYGPKPDLGIAREPWIVVRHDPGPSETCTMQDVHLPFRGEADIAAVTDMAERHALGMVRRDARDAALIAGGHAPRNPPLHMLEATPLVALAWTLDQSGLASVDGKPKKSDGRLEFWNATMNTGAGILEIESPRQIAMETGKDWPDTVLAALVGRPVTDAIGLPRCGRDDIDGAIARLAIQTADSREGRLTILVMPAPVLPVTLESHGGDRNWLLMEPIPVA